MNGETAQNHKPAPSAVWRSLERISAQQTSHSLRQSHALPSGRLGLDDTTVEGASICKSA